MTNHSVIRRCLLTLLLTAGCAGVVAQSPAQTVEWVSSTAAQPWVRQPALALAPLAEDNPCDLEICPELRQQTIDGWGGCFNELGWDALQVLSPSERDAVLKAFFDPTNGLNYTLCRMPIGANDYAENWYSLDDTPDDFDLKHFNLDRDRTKLIPYIKAAMKYQPDLQIWGSPWSPPAWMKINHHYACKSDERNDLPPARAVSFGTNQFIQEPRYLAVYAEYLSRFVKTYRADGIHVVAVAIQNEPFACQDFPSCLWSAAAMRDFIARYVGPTFERDQTDAQIWYGTINNNRIEVFDEVLSDPQASRYISAVGLQWAGKNALPALNAKYPKLKKFQMESECGSGTFDWPAAEYTFSLMKHYLDNGVSLYTYWNMILDEKGNSTWAWKQNAQIVVNQATRTVTYTPEFYLFKHFSRFVPKGSSKVKAFGNYAEAIAFVDPQGSPGWSPPTPPRNHGP